MTGRATKAIGLRLRRHRPGIMDGRATAAAVAVAEVAVAPAAAAAIIITARLKKTRCPAPLCDAN